MVNYLIHIVYYIIWQEWNLIQFIKNEDKTLENSNEWENIKSEIERTDKKIDEEIYKLYRLTEGEIKIIEKNVKWNFHKTL